jgi:hypothetical protein
MALVVGHGREDGEFGVGAVAGDRHDGGDVAAAVAVVGGGPDCDDRLFGEVELVVFGCVSFVGTVVWGNGKGGI